MAAETGQSPFEWGRDFVCSFVCSMTTMTKMLSQIGAGGPLVAVATVAFVAVGRLDAAN